MSQEPDTRENVKVRFGWMGGAKFIDQWKREAEQIRGRGKGVGGAGKGTRRVADTPYREVTKY